MPTVFREAKLRAFFYSNEGDPREPIHIHVRRGSAEVKLWLEPWPTVARSTGFAARELAAIVRLVRDRRAEIEAAWHEHFGD
ncbi:uncharacterized protein DUF4160 [Hasllibacter halocynthiae]|uniref:Uncharacterized protein DUF4160 n=1 Tax=Hasllibacter halocynthiae TaxID=595589 RepID=A0A2T0X1Z2_9RHOB|nr:DUF4160 domain-containing protein [Hasllibacter halocynthiae]PRY92951.1 uncharacterized protein DUF4160 [Hasllibacter halocynthiae]